MKPTKIQKRLRKAFWVFLVLSVVVVVVTFFSPGLFGGIGTGLEVAGVIGAIALLFNGISERKSNLLVKKERTELLERVENLEDSLKQYQDAEHSEDPPDSTSTSPPPTPEDDEDE